MNTLAICRYEWARLFLTTRGWLSIVAFVLVWAVLLNYVIAPAASHINSPNTNSIPSLLFSRFSLAALANWPPIEIGLYWYIALYLMPFFSLLIAADQFASDKTRGTLRYILLRTSRTALFFGRFLSHCLLQVLLVLVTLGSVLLLIALNSPQFLPDAIQTATVTFINLALLLMPYVALMALVSVLAKSARQATLFAIVGWIVLSLLLRYVQSRFGPIAILDWVLPGSQVPSLIKLSGWDTLNLAPVPLIHTVFLLFIGWFAMRRAEL